MASDTNLPHLLPGEPYHHGDLANALRRSGADVLAERGVAGFSLREVARRAGVSHAAPAHHFGDAQGLLTAIAVEAFQYLTKQTEAALVGIDDSVDALAKLGRAYVTVAVEYPGHCAILFRHDAVNTDDPAYREWGQRAYAVLVGAIERLAHQRAPDLDIDLAAALCWSTVQGLLTVHQPLQALAHRHGRTSPPIGDLAERFIRLLVTGFEGHLR